MLFEIRWLGLIACSSIHMVTDDLKIAWVYSLIENFNTNFDLWKLRVAFEQIFLVYQIQIFNNDVEIYFSGSYIVKNILK